MLVNFIAIWRRIQKVVPKSYDTNDQLNEERGEDGILA